MSNNSKLISIKKSECEQAILAKFKEIADLYHQYNPYGEYLSLALTIAENDDSSEADWCFRINNAFYDSDSIDSLLPIHITDWEKAW